jgi:nitrogen fixation NifU-like protein
MDHFKEPHNVGAMADANAVGVVGNAACGDILKVYLKIDDNDIITEATFETFGCAAAIASSSVVTDMLKGKSIDEALAIKNSDVIENLEWLPPQKIHCSVLAEEAIKNAIDDYKGRKSQNN